MLQAYDPVWAFAANLREQAARWHRQALLDATQLAAIETAYPLPFYRPVWALRFGLFFFSWVGAAMATGFIALFVISSLGDKRGALIFLAALLAAACFGVLEAIIRTTKVYRAGPDNLLLYYGLGAIGTFISLVFDKDPFTNGETQNPVDLMLPLSITLTVLVGCVVRYADALVALLAVANTLALVCIIAIQSTWGTTLLPFIVVGSAVGLLLLYRTLSQRLAASVLADYYGSCLLMLKIGALVLLYLGGNYLMVREGNAALLQLETSTQVAFALLFYAFTALMPLVYIALGLRRADRTLLLMGLLTLAFSIFTLRYYRSVLPPEVAAVLAGTFLTALAGLGLRYLRPARFGLTSEPDDEPRHFDLENLIQAQTAHAPGAPASGGFEFGGGHSGGAGAEGTY